jgi:hypothetical protein
MVEGLPMTNVSWRFIKSASKDMTTNLSQYSIPK